MSVFRHIKNIFHPIKPIKPIKPIIEVPKYVVEVVSTKFPNAVNCRAVIPFRNNLLYAMVEMRWNTELRAIDAHEQCIFAVDYLRHSVRSQLIVPTSPIQTTLLSPDDPALTKSDRDIYIMTNGVMAVRICNKENINQFDVNSLLCIVKQNKK